MIYSIVLFAYLHLFASYVNEPFTHSHTYPPKVLRDIEGSDDVWIDDISGFFGLFLW